MAEYKVSELDGALLDAAAAKAEGYSHVRVVQKYDRTVCEVEIQLPGGRTEWVPHGPSREWSIGGPIIERERIMLQARRDGSVWVAIPQMDSNGDVCGTVGSTPLIAAMRAYVASKFGETVELP